MPPWATGPGEILLHANELLERESERNRRLAMLSVDNAVELMLKTYLNLPRRATGLDVPPQERKEAERVFPRLLDVMETYAPSKVSSVSMVDIEYYHGLRNQLYHNGNGLTVERSKVETYAALAMVLFASLFGYELRPAREGLVTWSESAASPRPEACGEPEPEQDVPTPHLVSFIQAAGAVDRTVDALARGSNDRELAEATDRLAALRQRGILSAELVREVRQLRETRDGLVRGSGVPDGLDAQASRAWRIASELDDLLARTGADDRIAAEWALLQRYATPELFRVTRTMWERVGAAVRAEGLTWAPRLYVKHGYFSFQDTVRRANLIGCVFRPRLDQAELAIRLPAPPEQMGLGRIFSNPQRWDEVHSQILIQVNEGIGIPDIARAVAIARRFNAGPSPAH
jgi:hypothetical protein